MKITLAAYVIGLIAIIYSKPRPTVGPSGPLGPTNMPAAPSLFVFTYRRVWGLTLLAAGAAILSDVAPRAVGPYMALVALVFLLSPSTGLGKLLGAAEKSASQPTKVTKGA